MKNTKFYINLPESTSIFSLCKANHVNISRNKYAIIPEGAYAGYGWEGTSEKWKKEYRDGTDKDYYYLLHIFTLMRYRQYIRSNTMMRHGYINNVYKNGFDGASGGSP